MYQGVLMPNNNNKYSNTDIFKELGDKRGIATTLCTMGDAAYYLNELSASLTYLDESLSIYREIGDKEGIAFSLHNLGNVAAKQGEHESARSYYIDSLNIRMAIGDKRAIAGSLVAIAQLEAIENNPFRAAALWGAAETLRDKIASPLPPNEREEYDRNVNAARLSAGVGTFTKTWDEGRAMTIEQAVEFALNKPKA